MKETNPLPYKEGGYNICLYYNSEKVDIGKIYCLKPNEPGYS